MLWIILALCAALFQAIGAAIKKKSLQVPGMNNVIGFVSFATAGIVFGIFYFLKTGNIWPQNLSHRFWEGMAWYAGLNVIAFWFMYRALDLSEFNHLMPYMTLTSLSVIIPPMILLGEIPTPKSFLGIVLIVIGAIAMNLKKKGDADVQDHQRKKDNRKGVLYFLATAVCFTITPTVAKIAIQESSVLWASFVVHLAIGLGFLAMLFVFREQKNIKTVLLRSDMHGFLIGIMLAGLAIVVENGSANTALDLAPVANVMAIKRIMPLFAFLIGLLYFKERTEIRKKIMSTALMILGAILVTI